MKTRNLLGLFGAVLALALIALVVDPVSAETNIGSSSTLASISYVEIGSLGFTDGSTAGVFAGENLNMRIIFRGISEANDVRVTARILGEPGLSVLSERFDVLPERWYSKALILELPTDVDPDETFTLEVTLENNAGEIDSMSVVLQIQRASYTLEILSVDGKSKVQAGETLAYDVVVRNNGRQESENTFVEVRIPELGINKRVFVGDLTPEDQIDPDKEDTEQAMVYISIPSNAPAGLYNVEISAFGDDASTTVLRRLEILGAGSSSNVFTSMATKNFASGDETRYDFTIVNSGDAIKVYTLIPEADNGLSVSLDETTVAVPAGSSKTVELTARAMKDGNYNFKVNVHSADGELIGQQSFVANVEGTSTVGGNAAIVLTIILAIIFVVLLVVLIVLLTRKPEKSEDFGESYY
ncbi:MAG: hypothetical protein Q8P57_00970 [Candidatus Pacearchaeota archaeon]|nr:hypothetical protein [Candidatus Pacearchaeota archaeon]